MTDFWVEFYSEFFHFSGVQSDFGQKFYVSLFVIIIKNGNYWYMASWQASMYACQKIATGALNTQVGKGWTWYKSSSRWEWFAVETPASWLTN